MAIDLQSNIVIGADTRGVEAGMQRAGRAVEAFGSAAEQTSRKAEADLSGIGRGGDVASKAMTRATRGMEGEIQKQIAAMQAGSTESRAYWESLASQKGIGSGALQPLLDELDAVSAKTAAATESAQRLEKVRSVIGSVAGSAVLSLAEASLRTFIEESIKAEKQQAQLAAVLKSTGEAAGWSRDKLNEMAGALSGSSSYSSGEINEAQTRLLTYAGIVGKAVPETMQAVVDLAAGTGRTVAQSAELLGEAINAPSKGMESLSKIGIQFGQDQVELAKKLESSGQLYEAQQIVLGKLESSYGGAAVAARNTFGGALSALQNTFKQLLTGDGKGMEGMRLAVEGLTAALGDPKTREAFQTFVGWAAQAATVLINFAANYAAFRKASNREEILTGTDEFGTLTRNAEAHAHKLRDLTDRAERFKEAIDRGSNVEQNQRNYDKLSERINVVRAQALAAAEALTRFANANDARPNIDATAFDLSTPSLVQEKPKPKAVHSTTVAAVPRVQQPQKADPPPVDTQVDSASKDAQKSVEDLAKSYAEKVRGGEAVVAGLQRQIASEKEVAAAIGLTKREVVALGIAKLDEMALELDRAALKEEESDSSSSLARTYRDEAKARRELAQAKRETAYKSEAAEKAAEDQKALEEADKKRKDAWERYTKDINSGLTDALMRGFENGEGFAKELRDAVVNMFKTMVLRPVISAALGPVSGAIGGVLNGVLGGGGAGAASGAGGVLNLLSSANSLYGAATGYSSGVATMAGLLGAGQTAGATAASLGYANAVGAAGGDALGALIAGNAGWSGVAAGASVSEAALIANEAANSAFWASTLGASAPSAAGASAGGGAAAQAAGMGPYGWMAAAAILAVMAFSGKGEKRSGGQYELDFDSNGKAGDISFRAGPSGGEVAGDYARKLITGTTEGINTLLKDLGSDMALTGFQAGLETSGKGRGGVYVGGTLTGGVTFGESGIGNNYEGTMFERTSTQSPNAEEAVKNFATDMLQATVQALQAATDLPKVIANQLKSVDAEALTDEAATTLLTSIKAQIEFVKGFRDAINQLPFENLRDLSFDTATGLIAAAGGLDALNQNLSGYFENYFSAEEQREAAIKRLSVAFDDLGLELPALSDEAGVARAQFRALAEGIDVGTEAGQKQYAGLLALQGAFAELTPAVEGAAAAIARSAADIASERDNLQRQIWSLVGDTGAIRAADLAKLDESNRPLQEQIWALQEAKAAAEAAAAAQAAAAQSQAAAAQAAASFAQQQAQEAQRVQDAWSSVGDSLIDEIKRIRGEVLDTGALGSAHLQSQFVLATVQARAGDEKAASSLPQLSQALLALAKDNASSAIGFKQMQLQIAASLEETLRFVAQKGGFAVPAFASGGTHQGGWAMVGENGAELAYMPPARIYTAGQTGGILDDSAMLEEMRQLRTDNRAQAGEIARLHLRVAKVLEKWEGDGMPSQREEVQA